MNIGMAGGLVGGLRQLAGARSSMPLSMCLAPSGALLQPGRLLGSSTATRFPFSVYLKDVPKPSPERRAEMDEALAAVKEFKNRADPALTFELYFSVLRDTYLHRGAVLQMRKVALLLNKVHTEEQFKSGVKLLKHLQRGGHEFGRHVSNTFIYASIRAGMHETALDLLHRSVLERGNIDEEPLYRIFPHPQAYQSLIDVFLNKGELDKAFKAFSIAAAQHRDNPDTLRSWNKVFLAGMKCLWLRKRYAEVTVLFQEVLHRRIEPVPGMYVLLARVEARRHHNVPLILSYRDEIVQKFRIADTSIFWNEITALAAYSGNDSQLAASVQPSHARSVTTYLSRFFDPEKIRALFSLPQSEDSTTASPAEDEAAITAVAEQAQETSLPEEKEPQQ